VWNEVFIVTLECAEGRTSALRNFPLTINTARALVKRRESFHNKQTPLKSNWSKQAICARISLMAKQWRGTQVWLSLWKPHDTALDCCFVERADLSLRLVNYWVLINGRETRTPLTHLHRTVCGSRRRTTSRQLKVSLLACKQSCHLGNGLKHMEKQPENNLNETEVFKTGIVYGRWRLFLVTFFTRNNLRRALNQLLLYSRNYD